MKLPRNRNRLRDIVIGTDVGRCYQSLRERDPPHRRVNDTRVPGHTGQRQRFSSAILPA